MMIDHPPPMLPLEGLHGTYYIRHMGLGGGLNLQKRLNQVRRLTTGPELGFPLPTLTPGILTHLLAHRSSAFIEVS